MSGRIPRLIGPVLSRGDTILPLILSQNASKLDFEITTLVSKETHSFKVLAFLFRIASNNEPHVVIEFAALSMNTVY